MRKKMQNLITAAVLLTVSVIPLNLFSQVEESFAKKYFNSLPAIKTDNFQRKYRMTTIHINRDLHGAFQNKTRVTGDYTRGFADGHMTWNNVFIAHSDSLEKPFSEGTRQDYIETSATSLQTTCSRLRHSRASPPIPIIFLPGTLSGT